MDKSYHPPTTMLNSLYAGFFVKYAKHGLLLTHVCPKAIQLEHLLVWSGKQAQCTSKKNN